MKPTTKTSIILLAVGMVVGALYLQMTPAEKKHHSHYHQLRGTTADSLYEGTNSMFASSGKCDHCHGQDPNGLASVDALGNDINVVDDWRTSMMANSAKDPYWRAKVSHEITINPGHQQEIESLCTRCHAPLGRFAAMAAGADHYSIAEMVEDSVALDGVSCLACHRQLPQPETALHTGQLTFEPTAKVFGPYTEPLVTPMALSSGYVPEHGAHIRDAKLCAGCHSLVTQTADLSGNLTGGEFVEQATWHEWLNSDYAVENTTCQSCHVPEKPKTNVILAAGYDTPPRFPYGEHELVGGNVLMLRLMKENKDDLDIVATNEHYDETIAKTINNLQNRSIQIQINNEERDADSLYFNIKLTNIAGHKVPSGYPSRRMSMFVTVRDVDNNIIWQSGGFDGDFAVLGEDATWEPHHPYIRNEEDVQIYEMVMGDVAGNRTTVLERGAVHLKDNRLVPRGFSADHPVYDTTEVVLNVADADFNQDPNLGSGTDRTYYRVPVNGYQGEVTITAEVYYQSVPPNWVQDLFALDTEPINAFENMFTTADKSPVLMKTAETQFEAYVGVGEQGAMTAQVWMSQGRMMTKTSESGVATLYTIGGQQLERWNYTSGTTQHTVNISKGTYVIILKTRSGATVVKKVVV